MLLGSTIAFTGASKSRFGTVDGAFRMIGGAPPGINKLVPGIVTFNPAKNNRQSAIKIAVSTSGKFKAHLGVGTWNVSGRTPNFDNGRSPCNGGRITVKNGQSVRITIYCDIT
jgi:hypothetical protein